MLEGRPSNPKPLRIIGVAGFIGAGKTLAASMIPDATHLQWADPIYRALAAMFDVDEQTLRDRSQKESIRHMLRTLGTEWGRNLIHEDLWVRLTMERIDRLSADGVGGTFAICGTRFPNEIKAIRDRGGEVWWVTRPGNVMVTNHSSDKAIRAEDCDRRILNDGPIESLRAYVQAAYLEFCTRSPGT